jgi:hypothetical protein
VSADAGGHAFFLYVCEGLLHNGYLVAFDTVVAGGTVQVYRFNAAIDNLVDIGSGVCFHGPEVEYNLDFAACVLFVFEDYVRLPFGNQNGVNAVLFCQGQRLEDFLLSIVGLEEFRDVDKVTRMRPAADEVAAEDKPADCEIASFGGGGFVAFGSAPSCIAARRILSSRPTKPAAPAIEPAMRPRRVILCDIIQSVLSLSVWPEFYLCYYTIFKENIDKSFLSRSIFLNKIVLIPTLSAPAI